MTNYIEFDLVPIEEECAQTGEENYYYKSRLEGRAIRQQLERMFGNNPKVMLVVKSVPHDFGSYNELRLYYNEDNEDATNFVFNIEENFPAKWDDEAKAFLEENGYYMKR